ncbi:MAG TPA: PDZ domain-containing protein [Candidatus Polarisedimenticolaceae bacterium]|nr:PDZ domain-containing protein [Candidatus Polarisedimenticolaceae bacterium]
MQERKAWWAAGTLGALVLAGLVTAGIAVTSRAESSKDDEKIRKKHTVTVVTPKAERGAFLGVRTSEETSEEGGARVDMVVDDSPADDAGIREGDVIISFDGATVRGPEGLTERIHGANPEEKVKVGILRDGKRETVTVTLGERSHTIIVPGPDGMMKVPLPDTEALEQHLKGLENFYVGGEPGKAWVFRSWGGRPRLGVQLVETTPELREHLGGGRDRGVLIGKVMTGKPAEKAGIKVGDLLVQVDGSDISDSGELVEALGDKDGKTVDIELVRDGKTMHVQVPLPAAEEDEDAISGPRAEAVQRAREELLAARMAQRDAMRQVRQQLRQAQLEALEAHRAARATQLEAGRESRERQRETMRQLREELRQARAARVI